MINLYEEYAVVNSKLIALEKQKEQLRNLILEEMVEKEQNKVETGVGIFSIAKLKSWTYPARVTKMNEAFKAEKAKAESTGEATYVEMASLRFSQVKL